MKSYKTQLNGILLAAAVFTLTNGAAMAKSSGASFLKVDPSPRAFALGGSNAVASYGAQAIGSNPANLGISPRKFELFTAFSNLVNNEQYSHVGMAINRSATQRRFIESLGISVTHLKVSDLEGRDRSGGRTGTSFGALDRAIAISGSTHLGDMRLGLTGKAIQQEIAGYSSGLAMAADLGMNYQLRQLSMPATFGLAVRNLGSGVQFVNQKDPLPTSIDAGFGLGVGPAMALLGVTHLMQEQKTNVTLGMEFGMGPLALRAGYHSGSDSSVANNDGIGAIAQNFSTGFGLHFGSLKLDYAMSSQAGGEGFTHHAALTFQWGQAVTPDSRKNFIGPQSKSAQ